MATLARAVPDHVLPELVWDNSYYDWAADTEGDPFRRVGALHAGPEMIWATHIDRGEAGWIPTRARLIREVLTDAEHFASGMSNMMGAIGLGWQLIPLETDPPQHQQYRKVLEPFFTPAAINALEGAVRATCDELIDTFADKGGCEFAADFAEKFPSYVFLDLMGMPRERLDQFLEWERAMLRVPSPESQVAAMTEILHYLEHFIAAQRAQPGSALMQGIISARYAGTRELTETEMLSICYVLYIGGLDTVFSTLGWIFWHLAQDQALQDRLRANPDDIPKAVEELLRAFSTASSQRRVREDFTFHGVPMKKNDIVQISLPLAARDPEEYEDPHVVDIDRPVRHIAFGTGTHTCIGLRLAKREIRVVLEAFLSRFRNIRMPAGESHAFHTGNVFGIDRLPLEWDTIA